MQKPGTTSLNKALDRLGFTSEKIAENKKAPQEKTYRYPYMDAEAIRATIQNAKKLIAKYNEEQYKKSEGLKEINADLRREILKTPHTTKQKILWLDYKRQHKMADMPPMRYNTYAIKFNKKHSTNFLMREYKGLKNEMALTISHLVFFYAAQIRDNNARKLNAGVTTAGTLPRLYTNSESLRRYKIEGVRQCPYHRETLLKHIHNLVKVGVLRRYKNHGRSRGFSVLFSPEILTVKDVKSGKKQTFENERLKTNRKEKDPHHDDITRTVLNKYRNKGDKTPIRNERSSKPVTSAQNKSTPSIEPPDEITKGRRGNFSKKQAVPIISRGLKEKIKDTWALCTQLADDQYVNHIPIPLKVLREEAKKGVLTQFEFREVIFQDFLKYISKLKRGNQSAAGAFYRAFEVLDHEKLVNFAGRYYRKTTMVDEYQKWLWMVDHAERWGKKREWNFLYINDYLDTSRRDAKEVGFWYLEKQYKANERKKSAYHQAKKAKKAAAKARKKKIKAERVEKYGFRSVKPTQYTSDYDKARKVVRKYLRNEMLFEEMHRYCRHNLSENIVKGIQKIIKNEKLNMMKWQA